MPLQTKTDCEMVMVLVELTRFRLAVMTTHSISQTNAKLEHSGCYSTEL